MPFRVIRGQSPTRARSIIASPQGHDPRAERASTSVPDSLISTFSRPAVSPSHAAQAAASAPLARRTAAGRSVLPRQGDVRRARGALRRSLRALPVVEGGAVARRARPHGAGTPTRAHRRPTGWTTRSACPAGNAAQRTPPRDPPRRPGQDPTPSGAPRCVHHTHARRRLGRRPSGCLRPAHPPRPRRARRSAEMSDTAPTPAPVGMRTTTSALWPQR